METMIKTETDLYSDETRAAYREAYQKLIDENPGAYPWFAVETNEVNSQGEEPDMAELWCTMRVMDDEDSTWMYEHPFPTWTMTSEEFNNGDDEGEGYPCRCQPGVNMYLAHVVFPFARSHFGIENPEDVGGAWYMRSHGELIHQVDFTDN